jgi:hypothetical protein
MTTSGHSFGVGIEASSHQISGINHDFKGLLLNVACSFSVKEAILTWEFVKET